MVPIYEWLQDCDPKKISNAVVWQVEAIFVYPSVLDLLVSYKTISCLKKSFGI